jgi:hypothetical protein
MIGRDLQMRDEELHVFGVAQKGYSDEGIVLVVSLGLNLIEELLEVVHWDEAWGFRIVFLPDLLNFINFLFELWNAFFFIWRGKAVQNNCHEQVQENDTDNEGEKDEEKVTERWSTAIWLSIVSLNTFECRGRITIEVDLFLAKCIHHHGVPTLTGLQTY